MDDVDRPAAVAGSKWLFITCFVALIATSFAFMTRALIMGEWAAEFALSETQKGELFGAGLWPFAISIVLFSLVIDKVGYGKALAFAFVCHLVSVVVTLLAPQMLAAEGASADAIAAGYASGYRVLYWGNFIAGLAAGTVEAVINPVIATVYAKNKTKWLNILHAGWPAGLVLTGLLILSMKPDVGLIANMVDGPIHWGWKVGILLVPTLIYGAMLLRCRFPVNERVQAGVSYRSMLAEVGGVGALIAVGLVLWELNRVFAWGSVGTVAGWEVPVAMVPAAAVGLAFLGYTFSLGRPLFIFLLLVMILLATTELGTDAWIKELMGPPMEKDFNLDGGWVLVYSATVMLLLRIFCGPVVKALNPIGLLLVSCLFAAGGLIFLSTATGVIILAAATVYAIGQAFFWPTTLGLVAERFPKGGALTLNAIAGVGMLGVGILGAPLLGYIQDSHIEKELAHNLPVVSEAVLGEPQNYLLGEYRAVDMGKLKAADQRTQDQVMQVQDEAKQGALFKVAVLPLTMFVCYIVLWVYFRMNGGYKAEELPVTEAMPEKEFRPV